MTLNRSIRDEIIKDHQRLMSATLNLSRRNQIIQNVYKRVAKINFNSIEYHFEIYLESKKIQHFRYSIFNNLGIFEERELLQCNDILYLQGYINNCFEPNIYRIKDNIDDILRFLDMTDHNNNVVLKYYQKIIKLCIQYANIKLVITWQSSPIEVLKVINSIWESKLADIRHLYDPEMIAYIMQNCPNIKDVLKLIPRISSEELTKGLQKWQEKNKRKNAAIKIQQTFIQWLYRPGSNVMKNAESHFYQLASTIHS